MDRNLEGIHPAVVLSHGGIQYSYQMAFALQEAELLRVFWTTFYSFRNWKRSPRFLHHYLERRYHEGLKRDRIVTYLWPEAIQRTLTFLLGKNYLTIGHLPYRRNRFFDHYVSCQLRKVDFDIFIGLSGSCLNSLKQAKALGKLTIVDQHDIHYQLAAQLLQEERELHPEFAGSMPYWPPLQSYLEYVRKELEFADFILVPSSFSLRSHIEAGIPREKLILLPHGVELPSEDSFFNRQQGEKFRILFVGTITQRKGIKYLLEAVKQLRFLKIELVLIGDQMVDQKALTPYEDCFRYIGYIPYHQLKCYFKDANLLVLPSIYDAFGLVVLDAMAAGLPVIVSENTAGGSDLVRDGIDGFVVQNRDVEALKNRILRLYGNVGLQRSMGKNASERAKEFSLEIYQQRLTKIVEDICQLSLSKSQATYAT